MIRNLVFAPHMPWPLLAGMGAVVVLLIAFAAWRGLGGWFWRGAVAALILLWLAGPSVQKEDRVPLSDIVLMVVDESSSQGLSNRAEQTAKSVAVMEARLSALPNTELRVVRVGDAPDNRGTALMTALSEAMADVPQGRLAGAVMISDGQVHDLDLSPEMPAPLHLLLTGNPNDWDRRLTIENAPAFAILGEEVILTLKVEDQGKTPAPDGATTPLFVSIDGGEAQRFTIPIGREMRVPLTLPHGGMNVLQFSVPETEGELTARNNMAMIQINGVRDRLRVLLVSGEPHNGERTWRNLLKSDASVDLVHFTILRPPNKQDGVPVSELSLIAFPTRELFMEKVDDFDLIIFDRYKLRGILPAAYLKNTVRYVKEGGAVLFAAGPDFASADSLYHSPLSRIIPARPSGQVVHRPYQPYLSELGLRHPVTEGLHGANAGEHAPTWGRWFRQIELIPEHGTVVMSGAGDKPLLVLDRVGDGRVAVLGSDHAWLWSRGVEGGGPQLELLRRLAHWMMKEPELEEEALTAHAEGNHMVVTRRTLGQGSRSVTVVNPSGDETTLQMRETSPGTYVADYTSDEIGLYRLREGDQETVIVLGPAAPREFEETIAAGDPLAPLVKATRGGVMPLSVGLPSVRLVGTDRVAAGRGWIGLTPRDAYETRAITRRTLLPGWVWLLALSGMCLAAWLREGRS